MINAHKKKEKKLSVCFTGHRYHKLGASAKDPQRLIKAIYDECERMITEDGAVHFISGMAQGTDIFASLAVLELKEKYPFITLECALPCESQAEKWSDRMRDIYFSVIEHCDKETMVGRHYTHGCMQKRNMYMVDSADRVIAVWDGSGSGTGNTVKYALSSGKPVYRIDPDTLSVSLLETAGIQSDGEPTLFTAAGDEKQLSGPNERKSEVGFCCSSYSHTAKIKNHTKKKSTAGRA